MKQATYSIIGTLCCIAGWAVMGLAGAVHWISLAHGYLVRSADWLFIRAFDLGSR